MSKKWLLVSAVVVISLAVGWFLLRNKVAPTQAKLEITQTNVQASVYINGRQVSSSTPHEEYRKPGEITLRLVPSTTDKPLAVWETRVTLAEGVTTVVRREFRETEADSAGEVLSFEKIGGKKAELAVVTIPDSAEIKFDGSTRGFSPLPITNALVGEHTLAISHPGYTTREIARLKTVPGYKLTAVVYLAEDRQAQEAQQEAIASASAQVAPDETKTSAQVEIQETGTGFLRVRAEASKTSDELGRVTPGKQYPMLDTNKEGDWYKIEYEKGKQGWVSAQYAKKV